MDKSRRARYLKGFGLIVLCALAILFIFPKSKPASSEAGFVALSPSGSSGGAIIPASCELGFYHDAPYFGQPCTSASNICGMTNAGTYQCGQVCSAATPADSLCNPTATLTANPSTIDAGQSSTLTWGSTHANTCTAIGGFATAGNTSGSRTTGPLNVTTNYGVTCSGSFGPDASAFATVTVLVPTANISAAPGRINMGSTTTITWNATNVNGCTITKNSSLWKTLTANASRVVSGSSPDTPSVQTTYTLNCTNNASVSAAAVTATQLVNVNPGFQEF